MIRIHWRNSDGQVAEFLARARDVTGSPQGRGDYVAYRKICWKIGLSRTGCLFDHGVTTRPQPIGIVWNCAGPIQ